MSNVAIAYPNRMLELKTLHSCDWVSNATSPLVNISTPVLSETARTTNFANIASKRCSFGLSLNTLPYRTLGAVALINHNLSTSAKVRFTVFNEPSIGYSKSSLYVVKTAGTSGTAVLDKAVSTLPVGTKLKFFACSSNVANIEMGDHFYATVVSHVGVTITFTYNGVQSGSGIYSMWYIGYGAQSGKTESRIVNTPIWHNVWKRVYATDSSFVTWRSKNLWRGVIEEEQRLSFTKIHISFLKDRESGQQAVGTHLHIDLNDTSETISEDLFIELGRVFMGQYTQPVVNPEYGTIEHNFIDNSEISATNSGTEYSYEKTKARSVSVQWNHLTEDEAFGGIYEAARSQGITREVLYAYDVDDAGAYQYARSFVGRFTQLNAITQPNFGQYGASINIKEVL